MTNVRLIYVTTPDAKVASDIAQILLEERLIACANILPQMQSLYHWQGKIESSTECVLILKTLVEKASQVMNRVKTLHPYEVPCMLSLSIDSGWPEYLCWLAGEAR